MNDPKCDCDCLRQWKSESEEGLLQAAINW